MAYSDRILSSQMCMLEPFWPLPTFNAQIGLLHDKGGPKKDKKWRVREHITTDCQHRWFPPQNNERMLGSTRLCILNSEQYKYAPTIEEYFHILGMKYDMTDSVIVSLATRRNLATLFKMKRKSSKSTPCINGTNRCSLDCPYKIWNLSNPIVGEYDFLTLFETWLITSYPQLYA